jgi:ABC-type bacteriocin/lantibiotic exporter with double-glycine peptidase domain
MWHRDPVVRQADGSDCGAAALATIALHYRRPIGLQRLRDLAGTDCGGTSLLSLLHAAEKLSFGTGNNAPFPSALLVFRNAGGRYETRHQTA